MFRLFKKTCTRGLIFRIPTYFANKRTETVDSVLISQQKQCANVSKLQYSSENEVALVRRINSTALDTLV
jgi:hypothetical protein